MMTDKDAHAILASLDEWAREKVKRGEGWAPGQYRALVDFLSPTPVLEQRKETVSWPKKTETQKLNSPS